MCCTCVVRAYCNTWDYCLLLVVFTGSEFHVHFVVLFQFFYLLKTCCSFTRDKLEIPMEDRQKALLLLLELSLQRGCLQHILDCILLLLQLADEGSRSNEPLKANPAASVGGGVSYPVVPFLRRLGSIMKPNASSDMKKKRTVGVVSRELPQLIHCAYRVSPHKGSG